MMSMLETLKNADSKREVTFIHAARNETLHAFAKEATEMTKNLETGSVYFGYEEPLNPDGDHQFTGYIERDFLADKVTKDTICYVCGPVPFLQNVVHMLTEIGIPSENIRYEFFGPAISLEKVIQATN